MMIFPFGNVLKVTPVAWCSKSIQDKFVKITMGHLSVIAQDSFQVTISLSNVYGHGNCLHSNVTCFQPSFQTIIDLPVKGASSDSGGRWVCIQVKYWGKVTILFQLHHLQTHQPTSISNVEALTVEGNAPDGLLINLKKSYAKGENSWLWHVLVVFSKPHIGPLLD